MKETTLEVKGPEGKLVSVPAISAHTLVVGSGAAGLNAAIRLRANGIEDILILTEGLEMGTSINTGSDKQTYYKLSLCGNEPDSPAAMAETFFSGGSMHGDLALVEASLSTRAFMSLVNSGVPFPRDAYGQFVGYKTDHDPRQRATSIGPYTSREMCRALIREIKSLGIPVREDRNAVRLLVVRDGEEKRAAGAVAVREDGSLEVYTAVNTVLAVGGPGGLYKTSVYPEVHTGAIGLALMEGARAQNLPESQYGMASIGFRWNVSGTYMQVIPAFVSTGVDGKEEQREFLRDYFESAGDMNSNVFLKGYQWPFDSRKIPGGSSIVDIVVYIETVVKGRRVFLDFRRNPEGFSFEGLSAEAREYLAKSKALQSTPIERLRAMNPGAVDLYLEHGINLAVEPLEIAVCAQHNNGGLAGNRWWESVNVKRLFPVGEVNGSHGVYRPGGSALNSGQVGSHRAAEFIAHCCRNAALEESVVRDGAIAVVEHIMEWLTRCRDSQRSWRNERDEMQERMSRAGAHIRSVSGLRKAVAEAWKQWKRLLEKGCGCAGSADLREALKNRYLCFAHAVYLEAILFAAESGVGSRGSSVILDEGGVKVHEELGDEWRIVPEDQQFRERVLETTADAGGKVENEWVDRRPIPAADTWFETAWASFRSGEIYNVGEEE